MVRPRSLWLLGGFLLALAGTAGAQALRLIAGSDSLPGAASPLPVIPASEVSRRAEDARIRLQQLRAEIDRPTVVREIQDELALMAAGIDVLEKDPRAREPQSASSTALEDLRRECLRRQTRLEEWGRALERRAAALGSYRQRLGEKNQLWKSTQEQMLGDTLATRLLHDVDSVMALVAALDADVKAKLGSVLTLQGDVSDQSRRLGGILDQVASVEVQYSLAHITPERPPLWRQGAPIREPWTLAEVRARLLLPVADFARERQNRLVGQAFLFLVLAWLARAVRRRQQRWSQEAEQALRPFAPIFMRPIDAALLGTLLFTSAFYMHPPALVVFVIRLLAALAALRLLPGMLPSKLIGPIWGLGALYIVDLLEILVFESAELQRLHLLAVSIAALLGDLWLLRSRGLENLPSPRLGRFLTRVLRFYVLALLLAILANVVGSVQFADRLVGFVLRSVFFAVIGFVGAHVLQGIARVSLRLLAQRNLNFVREHLPLLDRRAAILAWTLIALLWTQAMLRGLGVDDPSGSLRRLLEPQVSLGSLRLGLGDILAFVVTLWVAILFSRLLRFVLGEDVLPRLRLARGMPETILQLIHHAVVSVGFLLAVAATGFDLTRLTILAGALGVGIGFGLQNLVNNFVSGLILLFERPIQVGDTVEIGPLIGQVDRIGIRSSTVRTFSGADVVVPNGNLISNELVNWTLSDSRRRIDIRVGVAYGSDIAKVQEVLVGAARAHPKTLAAPEPVAFFLAFGESSLDFELRFWTGDSDTWLQVSSDVHVAIDQVFREAGVVIPFPQRDLHLRSGVQPAGEELEALQARQHPPDPEPKRRSAR